MKVSSLFTAAEALEEITAMISYSEARILYFFRSMIVSEENIVTGK